METPSYIFDIKAFSKNVNDIYHTVKSHYPRFILGYSYKTNYYNAFLREANRLGLYSEIVSPQEYEFARKIGVAPDHIIYNGVIDDFDNKLNVALSGGIVNIENMSELMKFINYTSLYKLYLSVGIRVNFDLGNGIISRFGIDVNSRDFVWLCDKRNHPFLKINYLHFHFGGAGARFSNFFRLRVRKCVKIARLLGVSHIDIGGNIYGRMGDDFISQLPNGAPVLEDVCYAIGDEMAKCCPAQDMTLIAEVGSPVVSNAFHILTTITDVKQIRGQTFITCDCKSHDIGWSASKFDPSHEYKGPVSHNVKNAIVCGCECHEGDIIIRNYNGPAEVGGLLLIKNIGAYSFSLINDFISPGCRRCIPIEDVTELKR